MKVTITRMILPKNVDKVKAFFAFSFGDWEIDNMRLIEGEYGLFLGFPSRSYQDKDNKTKYSDIVRLTRGEDKKLTTSSQSTYNAILAAAVEEYERRGGEVSATPTPRKTVKAKVVTDLSLDDDDNEEIQF